MSAASGRHVWLKLECLQPVGSFKIRGIGLACEAYARQGTRRFLSSSGGNAGIAVAYAGRRLCIPVTVVVPETTTERAKGLIRAEDAEVVVHGASWAEANTLAMSMLGEHDAFLHPFDNPLLWRGHASVIDELVRSRLRPDAVVVSVGGGGLLSGIVEGLSRHGWNDVAVVAVETTGTASLAQSVRAGRRIELDAVRGVATSLGAKMVCEQAFTVAQTHPVRCTVVSDRAALDACERFLADHRMVVEPACGAALAVACEGGAVLEEFKTVVIVVCGGATATIDQIRAWRNAVAK